MLFYRTDVFAELGLTPPETWEEFYAAVEVLQKNNLGVGVLETSTANAGVSSGIGFFDKMLLQRAAPITPRISRRLHSIRRPPTTHLRNGPSCTPSTASTAPLISIPASALAICRWVS